MRICIVGGIFDKDAVYRDEVSNTPETTLAGGLEERGHEVSRRGHRSPGDLSEFEVVHVHHLGRGAVLAAAHPPPARLVFTNHWMRDESVPRWAARRFVMAR